MSISIGNYSFEGPYTSTDSLKDQSGVYAILGRNAATETWKVVDVGESGGLQARVANHDRADCWKSRKYAALNVAAYYCNAVQRSKIEQELRNAYNPPCGER